MGKANTEFNAIDKRKQKIKLLIADRKLQEDILLLRKKWNIPREGFSEKKDYNKWSEWINSVTDNNLVKTLFNNTKLETKMSRKEIEYIKKGLGNLDYKFAINEFEKDSERIMTRYGLMGNYKSIFESYLLYNNIDQIITSPIPYNVGLSFDIDYKKNQQKIILEIYPEATAKDLNEVFSLIKEIREGIFGYGRKRARRYIKEARDNRIWGLHQEGVKSKEIADTVNDEFPDEFLLYDDINKIISRTKKKNISHL